MQWLPISQQRYKLAEGPFWDARDQALYWADIVGRLACRLGPDGYRQWQLAEPVSAVIPCANGDALVTLASGVYRLDPGAAEAEPRLFRVADATPGNRANEARCDAQGRLWLGTMQNNIAEDGSDIPITRRSGGLFRVDPDGSVTQRNLGRKDNEFSSFDFRLSKQFPVGNGLIVEPALGALLAVSFEVSSTVPDELGLTLPLHKEIADAISSRDGARGVWACMTLIERAALTISRHYPELVVSRGEQTAP